MTRAERKLQRATASGAASSAQPPGADWRVPRETTPIERAFPANALELMPPWEEIPDEFKSLTRAQNAWVDFASAMFYKGFDPAPDFYGREGIDPEKAYLVIMLILGSYAPKHQHKLAAVAYLCSLWFSKVKTKGRTYK